MQVPYQSAHYPGSPASNGLVGGANCQVFAYELLRHYGREIPDFRSSELWEDAQSTLRVETLEPLDLLLWNSHEQAWGAHVGVYLGENQAIHLAKEEGFPAVWPLAKFTTLERYQVLIGAKRVKV